MGSKGEAAAAKARNRKLALVEDEKRGKRSLRGLLEAAPDSIVVVDRSGQIVHVNSQTERLFRYSREELIGRPVHLLLPELRASVENIFARPVVLPIDSPVLERVAVRKDGSEFSAELSLGVLESQSGGPLGMAFVRDTTDQRRIERTLRQSEAYFRLLCRASEKLARSLDYRETLQHAAEIAVPEFADCCVVVGMGNGGVLGTVSSWQRKGIRPELVEEFSLAHRSLARDSGSVLSRVLRDRHTVRHDLADDAAPSHQQTQKMIRELSLHSSILVPLMARKQLLGVLCCYASTRNKYAAADQDVAEDLAHRAALALDNALLHDRAR